MELCDNFYQLNKENNSEGDLVARLGNLQRAVGWCKTAGLAGREFPSGVGVTKRVKNISPASNFIRVRPLQRQAIKPDQPVGDVVDEVAAVTSPRNKVVSRGSFEASRPYATAFGIEQPEASGARRGVFLLEKFFRCKYQKESGNK